MSLEGGREGGGGEGRGGREWREGGEGGREGRRGREGGRDGWKEGGRDDCYTFSNSDTTYPLSFPLQYLNSNHVYVLRNNV